MILSEPVAFLRVKTFDKSLDFPTIIKILLRFCSVKQTKSERKCSNVELDAKTDRMASGTFIIVSAVTLLLLIIWLVILQNSQGPMFLFSNLVWADCASLQFAFYITFLWRF